MYYIANKKLDVYKWLHLKRISTVNISSHRLKFYSNSQKNPVADIKFVDRVCMPKIGRDIFTPTEYDG